MASLEEATAGRSLTLGVLLSGANPENFVLTASTVTEIVETDVHGADFAVAVTVYVILGSCTDDGAVVAHLVGGQAARSLLDDVRGSCSPTAP
ncbi:hypothetical protein ABZY16_10765 [Streptomyces sp. NPDC006553]|uniref:hypothetical protein n=1 Tax=Streptomyces sp. NPDC006553 TaxID=3157180 RepID=UPI00339EDD37